MLLRRRTHTLRANSIFSLCCHVYTGLKYTHIQKQDLCMHSMEICQSKRAARRQVPRAVGDLVPCSMAKRQTSTYPATSPCAIFGPDGDLNQQPSGSKLTSLWTKIVTDHIKKLPDCITAVLLVMTHGVHFSCESCVSIQNPKLCLVQIPFSCLSLSSNAEAWTHKQNMSADI